MPGYGGKRCLSNVRYRVRTTGSNHVHIRVVHQVNVAVGQDDSVSAGKAEVVPETSFLRLRWR
jgi:hypothetical protein